MTNPPETVLDKVRAATAEMEKNKISLEELQVIYKKYLAFTDFRRFEIGFAVWLSRELGGNTPIWLIIVGASGDAKTEQLRALNDPDGSNTRLVSSFTPKTLVSGKKNEPDLAPELDRKVVLMMDFAEMLNLHPNDKAQIWAQLRNLYDGYAGKDSGGGARKSYSGLYITMIAASTPAIDDQILIQNQLGTRELVYRPSEKITPMKKAWDNDDIEEEMRAELNAKTQNFLKYRRQVSDFKNDIPPEIREKIEYFAQYLAILRATASIDSSTGELRGFVYPEKPTRALKQLKRIFQSLKALDDNYSNDRAISCIKEVVDSSVDQTRLKVLRAIVKYKSGATSYTIAKDLRTGHKTVYSELSILWQLNLVMCSVTETDNGFGRVYEKRTWYPDMKNEITKTIAREEMVETETKQTDFAVEKDEADISS